MKTSEQQTLQFGEENSTLLPADGPANQFQQQVNEKGKMTYATCGQKTLEQFGRFDRASLWAKTFAALLIGKGEFYSTRCKLTWKLKATKCSRFYFQLQVLTLPIEGTGYGLLPTPLVMDTNEQTDLGKIDARRVRLKERNNGKNGTKKTGNGFGVTLGELMQRGLLPTPDASLATGGKLTDQNKVSMTGKTTDGKKRQISLSDYVRRKLMATPNASDYRSGMTNRTGGAHNQSLNDQMALQAGKTSQLNPLFVTEMMGFPVDWLTGPFLQNQEQESSKESKHTEDGEKKA